MLDGLSHCRITRNPLLAKEPVGWKKKKDTHKRTAWGRRVEEVVVVGEDGRAVAGFTAANPSRRGRTFLFKRLSLKFISRAPEAP